MARYEKGRKGETRARIVELASRRFRADGVDGVGIATLMADAGLTNGGFYAHFDSKEQLVKEAVLLALSEMPGEPARKVDDGTYDLAAFVDRYLSSAHRDHPEQGCAVAALSSDLMRRPAASRSAFQLEALATIDRIAAGLPAFVRPDDRRQLAFAVFAHLLGTIQMARLITDGPTSDAILARGRCEALRLAGYDAEPKLQRAERRSSPR